MSSVTLDVSIGEALDKLSILQIKCENIKDERVIYCKHEHDSLYPILKEYIDKFPSQYNLLLDINKQIWNLQNEFRSDECKSYLCADILNKNDIRFKIKNDINNLTNSVFREQKGY